MQPLGKGKALRPSRGGAWGRATWGVDVWGGAGPQEVYLTPGVPEGVSAAELKALPVPFQRVVMEAWFRANFQPAPDRPSSEATDPALKLTSEFGEVADGQAIETLSRMLAAEARFWAAEAGFYGIAAEARLGIVIASADLQSRPPKAAAQAELLWRIEAVERALAKLQPPHGGIGHNNPDDPLTREEAAEASAAITELREEASATRPDVSRAQRAAQTLAKAAAAVGRWIWTRAGMATDEAIKKAAGAGGVFTVADAMNAWQGLTALVEAVGRWISLLVG